MPANPCSCLCSFPRASTTNEHKGAVTSAGTYSHGTGGQTSDAKLLAGPCSLWRMQGASLLAASCFWWLLASPSIPRLVAASLVCLHPHAAILPLSLCLQTLSYYMDPSHGKAGSLQTSMTSSWLHRQRPHFQTQSIHSLGLEHNFGGTQSNPARCPQQAAVTVSSHYPAL